MKQKVAMLEELFPACAGVIPPYKKMCGDLDSFPRMCGGDPSAESLLAVFSVFSPHVRG